MSLEKLIEYFKFQINHTENINYLKGLERGICERTDLSYQQKKYLSTLIMLRLGELYGLSIKRFKDEI